MSVDLKELLNKYDDDNFLDTDVECSGIYPLFEEHPWDNNPEAISYIKKLVEFRLFYLFTSYQYSHSYCLKSSDGERFKLQLYNYYAKEYYQKYLNKINK